MTLVSRPQAGCASALTEYNQSAGSTVYIPRLDEYTDATSVRNPQNSGQQLMTCLEVVEKLAWVVSS